MTKLKRKDGGKDRNWCGGLRGHTCLFIQVFTKARPLDGEDPQGPSKALHSRVPESLLGFNRTTQLASRQCVKKSTTDAKKSKHAHITERKQHSSRPASASHPMPVPLLANFQTIHTSRYILGTTTVGRQRHHANVPGGPERPGCWGLPRF